MLPYPARGGGTSKRNFAILSFKEQTPTIYYGNVCKARLEELKAKEKLTGEEKRELEELDRLNKLTGGNFDLMGKFSTDPENSTIALMQKDEQFLKEAKNDRKQAEENWLKAQFEGLDLNNEKDFAAIKDRMSELWNNCASRDEKRQLADIVKRTPGKYFKQIHDDQEAVWKTEHAALYGDTEDQIETTRQVSESRRKKRISEETAVNIASAVPGVFKEEVRADAARILNEIGSKKVTDAVCQGIKDGKYTREDVNVILKDFWNAPYMNKDQKHACSEVIGFCSDDKQLEYLKSSDESYVKNQDLDGINAGSNGLRYFAAKNQAPATETHFNATLMLENSKDRENAQLTLTNQIEYFDASAQAEAHRIVCQSEFESVLTQAAENIYKYDESAQNDALQYTIATGNEEAIKTAVETAEKCKALSSGSKYYDSETAESVKTYLSQMLKKEIEQLYDDTLKNYELQLLEDKDTDEQDIDLKEEQEYNEKKSKNMQNPYKNSNALEVYNDIKNSPNKKEDLKNLIINRPDIIIALLRTDKNIGFEMKEWLGSNSPYVKKINEWMHKCHLIEEEETYRLNPGTKQGKTYYDGLGDIEFPFKKTDPLYGNEYLQA